MSLQIAACGHMFLDTVYFLPQFLFFPADVADTEFQGHRIIQRQITRKWYKIEL